VNRSSGAATRSFIAGAGVLAVVMGFGRFAYTPLLAVMRHDAGLTVALSGVLASANLAGYLCGALAATQRAMRTRRYLALCIAAIVVVVTTAAMALPQAWWLLARFVTGIASGIGFVLTVSLFLDRSIRLGRAGAIGIVFSGVGLGIALAGTLVPFFASIGGSRAAWLGVASASAVILALALPQIRDEPIVTADTPTALVSRENARSGAFGWLCAAYGIEGFAYIIPATFLVTMVDEAPGLARFSGFAWVVVGLVAAPAATMWAWIGKKFGKDTAFGAALTVQALGLVATIAIPGVVGALLLAATLGSTFVGITSLASALGREMRPHATGVAIGILTVTYGIGQILGPLVAVRVSLATGGYRDSLGLAAAMLMLAAVSYAYGGRRRQFPASASSSTISLD
jgi:predicted MFS family arabinose efflux permease